MRTLWFMGITRILFGAAMAFSLISCGERKQKKPYGVPPGITISAATPIDYFTVHYYSLRYCMKCHKDRVEPFFSSYESVVKYANEIKEQIEENEMPPESDGFSPLTACQKLVITSWLNAGHPRDNGASLGAAGNACY